MPAVLQSDLTEYVVKETLRAIRNGQVRLKKLGIECEPDLKVDFAVTVIIPGGLNAIPRLQTSGATTQRTTSADPVTVETTVSGEQVSTAVTEDAAQVSTEHSAETQDHTDDQSQGRGTTTTIESEYEA